MGGVSPCDRSPVVAACVEAFGRVDRLLYQTRRGLNGQNQPWRHVLQDTGAGEGNRTLVFSLEGCCSTIELHPRSADHLSRRTNGLNPFCAVFGIAPGVSPEAPSPARFRLPAGP
jgi:hypothetical protein